MCGYGRQVPGLISDPEHAYSKGRQKVAVGLDRLMGAIGPVTIILVSVVIGALVVSIMSALLSITELAL